jgi:hypothetical protein
MLTSKVGSRDSSVRIVTRLRAGRSGVRTLAGVRYFSVLRNRLDRFRRSLNLLFNGYTRVHSWGGGGYKVNHSPASSAEIKNEWSCTSAPRIWAAWCGQGQICVYDEGNHTQREEWADQLCFYRVTD